ncbi:MAG: acylneuraminate cytidylyltransferase family protein [Phycisphaerae bacterium]|nr:acylneuraminate cytidylyltransferase family protein [Phycisphaerae bacterium]
MDLVMRVLAVILARAGSKGLPDKCVLPLCGRPILAYALDHARESRLVEAILLTTDSEPAKAIAQAMGAQIVDRPAELATDTAPVDAVVRHAVLAYEQQHAGPVDAVVILYGNIPVRREGVVDRCIGHLFDTGCDSVRTVAPIGKLHPDWLHRLHGDRLEQYRPNSIHRRQDLEPLYYHDGAVVAVTRAALFAPETAADPHAFFGRDRRAVPQAEQDTVDIDTIADFYRAEAILRTRGGTSAMTPPNEAAAGGHHS